MLPSLSVYNPYTDQTFYQSLQIPINIVFGNAPSSSEEDSLSTFFIQIIFIVVLALVLMNFLIALISGTFERI